jgi:hypothetical protein
MIYFINKEISNTTYNFTYLNKYLCVMLLSLYAMLFLKQYNTSTENVIVLFDVVLWHFLCITTDDYFY